MSSGLSAELVRALDAAAQKQMGGDRVVQRLTAFGCLEETKHEIGHLLGLARARLRFDQRTTNPRAIDKRGRDVRRDDRDGGRRGDDRGSVASCETLQPVRYRSAPSQHWPTRQVSANVVGEILHRRVARIRLFRERLPQDRLEVAAQLIRSSAARPPRESPSRARAALAARAAEWRAPDEQLVEHRTELIDVGARRDRPAEDLLGRRVLGRHPAMRRDASARAVSCRAVRFEQLAPDRSRAASRFRRA